MDGGPPGSRRAAGNEGRGARPAGVGTVAWAPGTFTVLAAPDGGDYVPSSATAGMLRGAGACPPAVPAVPAVPGAGSVPPPVVPAASGSTGAAALDSAAVQAAAQAVRAANVALQHSTLA